MDEVKKAMAGEITLSANPGASMKKWREIFGITQTQLAEYLKISPSTISDYESNRRKSPGIMVIRRFVDSLLAIDAAQGAWVSKKLSHKEATDVFEVNEFAEPVTAKRVIDAIEGKIITNKRKVAATSVLGYSIVDSLRAILELPVDEFPKIYGPTTNRAVVFTRVATGRSPMVAIRVTKLKPALVIYHGLDKVMDPVAKKISEVEKIPLVTTTMELDKIREKLNSL
jgi:putative transcriptional regulator